MVKDELHQNNNIIWLHYQLFQCKPDPARKKSHKHLVLKTAGEFDWSEGGMVILAAATEHTHSYCAANSQTNSALKHARYHRNWNSWNVNFANPIHTSFLPWAICIFPHFIQSGDSKLFWFTNPNWGNFWKVSLAKPHLRWGRLRSLSFAPICWTSQFVKSPGTHLSHSKPMQWVSSVQPKTSCFLGHLQPICSYLFYKLITEDLHIIRIHWKSGWNMESHQRSHRDDHGLDHGQWLIQIRPRLDRGIFRHWIITGQSDIETWRRIWLKSHNSEFIKLTSAKFSMLPYWNCRLQWGQWSCSKV